jgi:hypothetical protein
MSGGVPEDARAPRARGRGTLRAFPARGLLLLACAGALLGGCRERVARFMRVDAGGALPPEPRTEEPNQIHFTFTGSDSVTFDWRGTNRALRIWSKNIAPREIEAHAAAPAPFSTPGSWQEAIVTGLVPGTEYGYEVGRPRRPVPSFFRTPPAPGTAHFAFAAMADVGSSVDFPEVRPVHRIIALGDPAFVLGLGDLTYADIRSQVSVDRHFEDVMAWSLKAAYMPVWGEHEWHSPDRDDLRNYKGRFALPNPQASPGAPEAACCGEDWYWFDYGNLRFIAYPEPYTDATWTDWAAKAAPVFADAEGRAGIDLVVTMGHRAAYSSSAEGGDARLRKILDGFGARFRKYVLNLSGHGQVYERTKPQAHVVHITVPPGGGELPHADTPCFWKDCKVPASTEFRAIHHGLLRFASLTRALRIEAFCGAGLAGHDDIHCAEGEIFDHVTIEVPSSAFAR